MITTKIKGNALKSLKETFKFSPIGTELGFLGNCEMKGKNVVSITRTCWHNTEALVIHILYIVCGSI
jgi:hypothetical protein